VAHADPVATTATVLKVVDGDTVDIVDDVRGRLRIRLLGIDTPETKKPGYTVGCWGPEASEFAKSTLLGQRVAFVTDPSQGMYDRFGRTLAYLDKADGWDYSVEAAPVRVLPIPMSITAIPRPEPTRLQLPNRKRRPLAGACGTAVLRRNDVSPNLIRRGAFAQRSQPREGPQWARSSCGTGMSSRWSSPGKQRVGPFTIGGDPGG